MTAANALCDNNSRRPNLTRWAKKTNHWIKAHLCGPFSVALFPELWKLSAKLPNYVGDFEAMRSSNDDIPPAEELFSREAEAIVFPPKDELVKDIGCSRYRIEIEWSGASDRLR